ncbi:MAG: M23 family metallopeptidase [Azoarcus sp.]|nr:M23 family metallopeptidase [Azoarcus sp.]
MSAFKNLLSVPVVLACAVSLARGAEEIPFKVDKIESGTACRIVAVNRSFAPVTVMAGMVAGAYQYRSNRAWPLRDVIAPNSSREIARIYAERNRTPCGAEMAYSHSVGDAFAVPDRHYRYFLPFREGTVARVTQEPTGVLGTHKDALSRYAVDFGVPLGTTVLAARAGTVIEVRDRFDEGRPDPRLAEKTNLVSILHSDGTFAQYAHLAPRSIVARPGERVEAGQMIGKSGNTGFAGGPHLHFDLRRARIGVDGVVRQESLPFAFFRQKSGKKITLKQQMRITAD